MADNFFVSIDIGTSKIAVLIAEEQKDGAMDVFGQAFCPSQGVKTGLIVDSDGIINAIKEAVKLAQNSCNTKINQVIVNISDPQLATLNREGQVIVSGKSISPKDVKSAIKSASAILTPANSQVIYKEPNRFSIIQESEATNVADPIGMAAGALKVQIHIVTVSNQAVEMIKQSLSKSGLGVAWIIPSGMVGAELYLSQEQKDAGICLLDIGAGVMNLSVFVAGSIIYSAVIASAGNQVTQAIADAFQASFEQAERLKIEHGSTQIKFNGDDKLIEFEQAHSNKVYYLSRQELIEVIKEAYLELFVIVKKKLQSQKLDHYLKAGFLLTGGGSKVDGCADLLMKCVRIKTKLAEVDATKITAEQNIISDPMYGCALGLLLHYDVVPYLETIQTRSGPSKIGHFFKNEF